MTCSFDIGYYNFAFYIDLEDYTYFNSIKISNNYKLYNIETFFNILSNFHHIFKQCKTFLIESQMYENKKIMFHLESWIFINFNIKPIFINSRCKNKFFNIKGKYKSRKLQTIKQAYKLMNKQELELLEKFEKKDDICDAYCQFIYFQKNMKKK